MKKATILIILLFLVSLATGCLRKLEDLEKDKVKYKTTCSFMESYQPGMKLEIDNDVGYIKINYLIKLPKKYSAHLKTEVGTIDIEWIIGNLKVEGDTTNIKINYMKGAGKTGFYFSASADVGKIEFSN